MRAAVLIVALLGTLRPPPASADDGYWYVVLSEVEEDEQFVIEGQHGRFLCSATTYCFGLDAGDRMFWTKNPWMVTNDGAFYDSFRRTCNIWDCEDVGSSLRRPTDAAAASTTKPPPTLPTAAPPVCTDATIREPNPFLANSGEVVVLSDGSVWKVGIGEYNYLYAYYASVTVCGTTMVVDGKAIAVTRLR